MADSTIMKRVADAAADCFYAEVAKTEDFQAFEALVAADMRAVAAGKARNVDGRYRKKRLVKVVKIDFRPDRKKMDNRKRLSEHPFGTLKRTLDGSCLLLKGKAKVAAEMSLLSLAYNIRRATAMAGAEKLVEGMNGR